MANLTIDIDEVMLQCRPVACLIHERLAFSIGGYILLADFLDTQDWNIRGFGPQGSVVRTSV